VVEMLEMRREMWVEQWNTRQFEKNIDLTKFEYALSPGIVIVLTIVPFIVGGVFGSMAASAPHPAWKFVVNGVATSILSDFILLFFDRTFLLKKGIGWYWAWRYEREAFALGHTAVLLFHYGMANAHRSRAAVLASAAGEKVSFFDCNLLAVLAESILREKSENKTDSMQDETNNKFKKLTRLKNQKTYAANLTEGTR